MKRIYFSIPIIFVFSIIIANRPPGLDRDYGNYLQYYLYGADRVELSFVYLSDLFKGIDGGFVYLLTVYAFMALMAKWVAINESGSPLIAKCYFLFFYFLIFFPLWELTQIRSATAFALFFMGLSMRGMRGRFLWMIFGVLFHYSAIIAFVLFLVYERAAPIFRLILLLVGVLLLYLAMLYTGYSEDYSSFNFDGEYNLYSLKNLFIFSTVVLVSVLERDRVEATLPAYLAAGYFMLYIVVGKNFPVMAIRFADVALFFSGVSLFYARNSILGWYRWITVIAFVPIFMQHNYFGSDAFIDLRYLG